MEEGLQSSPPAGNCTAILDLLETAFEESDHTVHIIKRERQAPIMDKLKALLKKFPNNENYKSLMTYGQQKLFTTEQRRLIATEFGIQFKKGNRFSPHIPRMR